MKDKILNYQLSIFNFKFSAKKLVAHPLFSGSAIMIVGSNLANFIAYIYHLIVGRLLGPAPYGELAAVLSLLGMVATTFSFLGLVIVKFVSASKKRELQGIFSWFSKKALIFGVILAFLLAIATPFLSDFLHIKKTIIFLLAPFFVYSVLGFVYRSFLQGLLKFKEIVIATNIDILGRLVLGVIFVYLGLSVFGAVLGFFLSSLIGFMLLRYYLREYRFSTEDNTFDKAKEMFVYAVPIFLSSISSFSLFSTDVILVKHFFAPHDAGIYASLSTLGKIIFYGAAPVGSVMFPMISKRHARGRGYKKIFLFSLLLTAAIAGGVLFVYWLLPELSIVILYGSKFLEASPYLVWFGLFMTIFTLASLILNYYLSKNQMRVVVFVVLAAIGQALGIWYFHDSILSVIRVSIVSVTFLISCLLIYFGYETHKGRIN